MASNFHPKTYAANPAPKQPPSSQANAKGPSTFKYYRSPDLIPLPYQKLMSPQLMFFDKVTKRSTDEHHLNPSSVSRPHPTLNSTYQQQSAASVTCLPNSTNAQQQRNTIKSIKTSGPDVTINQLNNSSNGLSRQSNSSSISSIRSVNNIAPANAAIMSSSSPNKAMTSSTSIRATNQQTMVGSSSKDGNLYNEPTRPVNQISTIPIIINQQAGPQITKSNTITNTTPKINITPPRTKIASSSTHPTTFANQMHTFNFHRSNVKITPKRRDSAGKFVHLNNGLSNNSGKNSSQLVSSNESLWTKSEGISSIKTIEQNATTSTNVTSSASSLSVEKESSIQESGIYINNQSAGSQIHSVPTTDLNFVISDKSPKKHNNTLNNLNIPFIWDNYLKATGSIAAPSSYFKQTQEDLKCKFEMNMKLETRDPRNLSAWCLATVVRREGIRIQLRLDGIGSSNDFWQLIDSSDIRPVGTIIEGENNRLAPPVGFTSCPSSYVRWVEKRISKEGVVLAPDSCFESEPKGPPNNQFKRGMKLEAVDKKNSYYICPATVGDVSGDKINVVFDGWKGSFDYVCFYNSRDIFPVGWCHRTGHTLQKPGNWPSLLVNIPGPVSVESLSEPQEEPASLTSREIKMKKISFQEPIIDSLFETTCQRTTPITNWKLLDESNKKKLKVDAITPTEDQQPIEIPSPSQAHEGEKKKGKPKKDSSKKKTKNAKKAKLSKVNMPAGKKLQALPNQGQPEILQTPNLNQPKKMEQTPQDDQSVNPPNLKKQHILSMSVDDVINFILKEDDILAKHIDVFVENEIDGKSFMLLTHDCMSKDLGLKLGPILKIKHLQKDFGNYKH